MKQRAKKLAHIYDNVILQPGTLDVRALPGCKKMRRVSAFSPLETTQTNQAVFLKLLQGSTPRSLTFLGALGDPCDAVVRMQDGLQINKMEQV